MSSPVPRRAAAFLTAIAALPRTDDPRLRRIFEDAAAPFHRGDAFSGTATLSRWREIFAAMRWRLRLARPAHDDAQVFETALHHGIMAASAEELTAEERAGLRDALASAFDGIGRLLPHHLAPKADYLRHVCVSLPVATRPLVPHRE